MRYFANLEVADVMVADGPRSVTVRRRPVGPVAAVTPWNFPLGTMVAKVAPGLMAGCTMVVKPSPYTPLTCLAFGEIGLRIVPPGVLNMLSGSDQVGALVCGHPVPRMVSFTGSIATGKAIAAAAAPDLKRITLELGGNDPAIVLDDADVVEVADGIFGNAFANCGQVCVAVKRVYAAEQLHDDLVEALAANDGRSLEVVGGGRPGGMPVVFHNGTPTAALLFPPLTEAAERRGLSVVTWSRPGYASSDPQPGRQVADVAADTATVLDAIGADAFITLGWSGGGPHALACAALLPGRCRAALTLAGLAPYGGEGLDWLAGMGPENIEGFRAATAGMERQTAFLEAVAPFLAQVKADDIADILGGIVSEPDKAALSAGFAPFMAEAIRRALSAGITGWRDDDQAFVTSWGFSLSDIASPVAVWHGSLASHPAYTPVGYGLSSHPRGSGKPVPRTGM